MACIVMVPGTTCTPFDGVTRHVYEISKRLACVRKDFVVFDVVPSSDSKPSLQIVDDSYTLVRMPVAYLRSMQLFLDKFDSHLANIWFYESYREAVRKIRHSIDRPIILHTHGFYVIAEPRKENKMCKRLVSVHGFGQLDSIAKGQNRFRSTLLHAVLKRVYLHADHYTTLSQRMKTMTRKLYGLDLEKITIVPHGVDSKFFSAQASSEETERIISRLELDKPHRVLFLGQLVKGKGLDTIMRAFKLLKQRRSDIMLILKMGQKEDGLETLRMSGRLDIRDIVRVVTDYLTQAELRALYKASDAFINYHFLSGHSTTLLEAMACGVPPIVFRHSVMTDVVDGSCGVLLETLDPRELADAIEKLVEDRNLALKLGLNAMNRVQEEYDWDRVVVPGYVSVYDALGN